MISLVIAFAIIILTSLFLAAFFECSIIKTIVPATLLMIVVMYIFALTGTLFWGRFAIILLPIMLLVLCINKRKQVLCYLKDRTFIIWLIFIGIIILTNYGRIYTVSDEFSHWGTAVKQMFSTLQMYTLDNSPIVYKEYPPASTLLELFFCMYQLNFNESLTFIGYYSFVFSMLFSVMGYIDKTVYKFWVKILMSLFLFLFMILWGGASYYGTLLADQMMTYLMAYLLFIYFMEEDNNKLKIVSIILGLFSLSIIKPSSIVFSGFFIVVVVFDRLVIKKNVKDSLPLLAGVTIASLLSKISWQIHLKVNGVQAIYSDFSGRGFKSFIFRIFNNTLSEDEQTVISDIVYRFFVSVKKEFPMGISPFCWLLFIFVLMLWSKNIKEKRWRLLYYLSIIFIVAWCFGTILTYEIVFPSNEGVSAYRRYIPSVVAMVVITFLMITLYHLKEKEIILLSSIGIVSCILLAPIRVKDILQPWFRVTSEKQYREGFGNPRFLNRIKNGEKVLVVYEHEINPLSGAGQAGLIYFYNVVPQNIIVESDPFWSADETVKDRDYITKRIMKSKPDYVYVWKIADKNLSYFSDIFCCDIENNNYYKITYVDNEYKFLRCTD